MSHKDTAIVKEVRTFYNNLVLVAEKAERLEPELAAEKDYVGAMKLGFTRDIVGAMIGDLEKILK